jgi:hypothetical protein
VSRRQKREILPASAFWLAGTLPLLTCAAAKAAFCEALAVASVAFELALGAATLADKALTVAGS